MIAGLGNDLLATSRLTGFADSLARVEPIRRSLLLSAVLAGGFCTLFALTTKSAFHAWSAASLMVLLLAAHRPRAALLVVAVATVLGTRIPNCPMGLPLRPEDLLLAATVVGVWLARLRPFQRDPPLLPVLLAAVPLLGFAAVRSIFLGTAAGWEPLQILLRLFAYALLYLLVARDAQGGGGTAYVYVLLIAGVILASSGIIEQALPLAPRSLAGYRSFDRGVWASEANHVGGELAGLVVVSAAVALAHARASTRRWALVGLPILALGLWCSGSRQAYGACGVAAVMVVIRLRPRLVPFVASGILLLIGPLTGPSRFWTILRELSQPQALGSLNERILNWEAALAPLARHPLLGAGLGSRPHGFYESQWVQVLAEGGVVGLFGTIVLVLYLVWHLGRREANEPAERLASRIGAFGFLIVLVIQGVATITFLTAKTVGPFVVLLGAVMGSTTGDDSPPQHTTLSRTG